MYKSYLPYLHHILEECNYVHSVITDEMELSDFLGDETLKRAVTRSLSIIGEAKNIIPGLISQIQQVIDSCEDSNV